jgi:hypothetical protein
MHHSANFCSSDSQSWRPDAPPPARYRARSRGTTGTRQSRARRAGHQCRAARRGPSCCHRHPWTRQVRWPWRRARVPGRPLPEWWQHSLWFRLQRTGAVRLRPARDRHAPRRAASVPGGLPDRHPAGAARRPAVFQDLARWGFARRDRPRWHAVRPRPEFERCRPRGSAVHALLVTRLLGARRIE